MVRRAILTVIFVAGTLAGTAGVAQAKNYCPTYGGKALKRASISFTITDPGGGIRVVTDLKGNVRLGDTITATGIVPNACLSEPLTLASYSADTAPPYTLAEAALQTLFDSDTGTFGPGPVSLTVTVPPALTPSDPGTPDENGTVIYWTGQGGDNLPCPDSGHWVLAPADGVTSAVLTVDGQSYTMTQNGQGSWAADSAGPITSQSVAYVTFTGENTDGMVLLSSCPHFQVDFVAAELENPPQYRLLLQGISHDAA